MTNRAASPASIQPFRIDIPEASVSDLHRRLQAARWPDELPDVGWDFGVASGYLRELADYWREGFDWRSREEQLNDYPQFSTEIDGQKIHFVHVRSPRPHAIPLLLLHGWPSTFADLVGLVKPLTEPDDGVTAFDVVIPSLPGFGFSGATSERGWGITRMARAFAELMRCLGYHEYMVQGGDAGSMIGPEIARIDPQHVSGVHVNALVAPIDWQSDDPTAGLTADEVARVYEQAGEWEERSGYAVVQSTRPQTLAYGLNDSPLGLLAWQLEWFVDYDPSRSTQKPVDRDAILTDVAITWFTGTAGSSARIYKEGGDAFCGGRRTDVPTAVAVFPGDSALRSVAERSLDVVRWTEFHRGGHFASLQAPDLLVDDVRAFAASLR